MKTAIIIPIYNVKEYLSTCINSVLNQSNRDFELILVDDGSTDGSEKICDGYLKENSDVEIKVIHKKNGGLVSAWKEGVLNISTETTHILFIDPDDWISTGYLDFLHKNYLKTSADVITTSISRVHNAKIDMIRFPIANGLYTSKNMNYIYSHFLNNGGFYTRGMPINRWGKLLKKELVIDNMHYVPNDVTFAEDLNLIFPIIINSSTIEIIQDSKETYYYRIRNNSMLRKYNENMWDSVTKVYKNLRSISINTNISKLTRQVNKDYVGAVDLCYKNNLENPKGTKSALDFIDVLHSDNMLKISLNDTDLEYYSYIDKMVILAIKTKSKFLQKSLFYILKGMKKMRNVFSRI